MECDSHVEGHLGGILGGFRGILEGFLVFSFISPDIPAYAAAGGVEMGFESRSIISATRHLGSNSGLSERIRDKCGRDQRGRAARNRFENAA